MSNEKDNTNRGVTNIYSLLDKELERLHRLLESMSHYRSREYSMEAERYYRQFGHYPRDNYSDGTQVYKRILQIQDIVLKGFESRDQIIQEKVAELALTGDANKEA